MTTAYTRTHSQRDLGKTAGVYLVGEFTKRGRRGHKVLHINRPVYVQTGILHINLPELSASQVNRLRMPRAKRRIVRWAATEVKKAELQKQKLGLEREKLKWKQLVGAAKGIGWVLDRLSEEEE